MLIKDELKRKRRGFIKLQADENGRLKTGDELVIQNLLISTDLDVELVSKLTNLDVPIIIGVYLKYSNYIDKILDNSKTTNKENKTIEKCLEMLEQHIAVIHSQQQRSENKLLYAKALADILKILDRLVAIKTTKIAEFDKLAGSLVVLTTKVKTLEKIESGELKLNVDSNYNFNTISDKLESLLARTNNSTLGDSRAKPVIIVNSIDNTVVKYPAKRYLTGGGISIDSIDKYMDTGVAYKGKYIYSEDGFKKAYPDRQLEIEEHKFNSPESREKK